MEYKESPPVPVRESKWSFWYWNAFSNCWFQTFNKWFKEANLPLYIDDNYGEIVLNKFFLEIILNKLGTINYVPEIEPAGLIGMNLEKSEALKIIDNLIKKFIEKFKEK